MGGGGSGGDSAHQILSPLILLPTPFFYWYMPKEAIARQEAYRGQRGFRNILLAAPCWIQSASFHPGGLGHELGIPVVLSILSVFYLFRDPDQFFVLLPMTK